MIIKLNITDKNTEALFRYGLIRDIILLVGKSKEKEVTISDIARGLGLQPNTGNLRKAVKVVVDAGLLIERKSGRGRFLRIAPNITISPQNPYMQIPQVEYRDIVKTIVERLKKLRGISRAIVFGGVARGTADRLSDIDVLVAAKTPHRITAPIARIMHECRSGRLLGERYSVNIKIITNHEIEHPKSFVQDALIEGITLYGSD